MNNVNQIFLSWNVQDFFSYGILQNGFYGNKETLQQNTLFQNAEKKYKSITYKKKDPGNVEKEIKKYILDITFAIMYKKFVAIQKSNKFCVNNQSQRKIQPLQMYTPIFPIQQRDNSRNFKLNSHFSHQQLFFDL
eukprot:TRINITY_DN9172_c0_g1_i12.p3 TRINITY_DN9172_c0_g1~~TRINITY_DN9172_c0_g1_i12.p3  ORF type:complete len:135 (+),score=2.94 TRINITY_DN9172_c0_g1_i12:349-753(+)